MKNILKHIFQTACALLTLACSLVPIQGLFAQNTQVTQDVVSGMEIYSSHDTLTATNAVENSAELILKAGERVFLKDYFHAKAGSRLSASIYTFFATDNLSDMYVDLYWSIETACLWEGLNADPLLPEELHGDLVYVEITREGEDQEIYHEVLTDADLNSASRLYGKLFSYPISDDRADTYRMSLYAIGSGTPLCGGTYEDEGITLPFQELDFVTATEDTNVGQIALSWQTESDLPTHYRIYRDSELIAIIDGAETSYIDHYSAGDPNTLVNGTEYNYCVEVFNDRLERAYPQSCDNGSTVALNLVASDNMYPDKVELMWNDASGYSNEIVVTRDGEDLATLSANATTYTDSEPIYGKVHEYSIEIHNEGQVAVAAFATGQVAANGRMAGRIVTQQGDYALEGVAVQAIAILEGASDTLNTVSDHAGYFEFTEVYYHQEATYTLQVDLQGHTFVASTQDITLTRGAPQITDIEFNGNHLFELNDNVSFTFEVLSIQPEPAQDLVTLNWNYAKPNNNDVVYFRIYRNGKRIAFLDDSQGSVTSFEDLTGTPGMDYIYEARAYIKVNEQQVLEIIQEGADTFPQMASPVLNATANATLGVADLTWTHTSQNFEGYVLLRDNTPIASLSADETAYADLTGVPDQVHTYQLIAQAVREQQSYQSDTTVSSTTYPALNSMALTANDFTVNSDGTVSVEFAEAHPANYNFDGYRIYRDGVLLHTVYKGFPRTYTDKSGIASTPYNYKVVTFLENADVITEGGFTPYVQHFPAVTAPENLLASQNTIEGVVNLSWSHASAYLDGFVVYRDQDSVAVLPRKARSYQDAINEAYIPNASYNYTLKAYTLQKGVVSYSAAVNKTGGPGNATGDNTPPMPEVFTASQDLHNQVRLQWDYPDYVLARFIVYRDGVELETLDTDQRLYYDYTAEQGTAYMYAVVADYEDPQQNNVHYQSQKAFAEGSVTSIHTVSGTIISQQTGFGLPGVSVIASFNGTDIAHTTTNTSGFYRFAQVPEGAVTIAVQTPYSNTIDNNGIAVLQVANSLLDYTADFTSSLAYEKPADTVAIPIIHPVVNALETTVEVRWTTRSQNYSGFKVYRGLVELADVKAEEENRVIDSLGYPGQGYSYRIKAYWNNPQRQYEESEFVAKYVIFPPIAPVRTLEVTPFASRDYTEITWSHPYDQHSYYEINRNDQLLGVVSTGSELLLKDSTGLPGQFYNYTVTAVEVRNGQLLYSQPVSTAVQFPVVAMPTAIEAEAPANQNHVALTWTYSSELFDGFRIFRNDQLIADTIISAPYPQDDTYHYSDYTGVPDQQHLYKVVGYQYKNSIRYESAPDQVPHIFPAITPIENIVAIPDEEKGTLILSWTYPTTGQEGYIIKRNGEELTIIADQATLTYADTDGIPGQNYAYSITAYANRGENMTRYESVVVNVNANFPQIPAPTVLTASDGDFTNVVEIQWSYTSAINDGFILYRSNGPIDTLNSGNRSYTDVFNAQASHTYKVKAFRNVDNVRYYSNDSNVDQGSNNYNNSGSGNVDIATNVQATDGAFANKVRITWEYEDASGLERFDIYRDELLIDNVTPGNTIYNDIDATPGETHSYQVVAVHELNGDSYKQADIGYRQGNGILRGSVITHQGGAGVPGIMITASAWVDDDRHDYTTTTDLEGNFELTQVYYGTESAVYDVMPSFSGHYFVEDTLQASLNLQENIGYTSPFRDKTAYLLKGNITYQNSSCAIDTVKVMLTTRTDDGTPEGATNVQEVHTNAQGEYTFVLNPYNPLLIDYTLTVDTLRIGERDGLADTTWHALSPRTYTFADAQNLGLITTHDIVDTTTYPVELVVTSTCGPVGTNRFDIRVSSTDGCFEQQYRTGDNGKITVNLLPLVYTVQVTGVENPSPSTIPIVDYLRVRPTILDLDSVHNDMLKGHPEALQEDQQAVFIYHVQPQITISSGFDQFLCGDPTMPVVIQEGTMYTLDIAAHENHNGELCAVTEGYLVIKNAAANDITAMDTLYFDPEIGGFPTYEFIAGDPITIAPYVLAMVMEYHTDNGGYQGEEIQRIIVKGDKAPLGNDIIVSVKENTIQLPLFVLRDPPGDQSYSYIEAGKTFSKSLAVSDMNSGGGGAKLEYTGSFSGIGLFTESAFNAGGGNGESASFNVSVTTTQRLETTADATLEHNYITGDQGDVIVGTGLSTAYGITEVIDVAENCEITKNTQIKLLADGLTTDWYYSVFQIEKLIEEYTSQIEAIDDSTLNIDLSNAESLEVSNPKAYLEALKNNWKQILQYHRAETVPMCNVCDVSNLPKKFRDAVKNMDEYNAFCNALGGTGDCDLEGFKWTNELMEQYNTLNQFRIDLEEYIEYNYSDIIGFNHVVVDDGEEALIITNDILNNVDLHGEYQQLYGPEVSNITFDGAVGSISNEVTIAKSKSRGITQKTYVDLESYSGNIAGVKISIGKGLGLTVTGNAEIDVENKLGVTAEYHFEFEKTKENSEETSATVGYVLDDDDEGDQFSVTVVKGIDPSHTPYFSLLGGRSSCPAEPGAISRYDPQLFVELPNGSVTKEATLYNVDPEGPASFWLKMASGNLFNENLLHYLYVPTELAPNKDDAEIFLQIGGENDGTGTRYIAPGVPQYTQVDIYRREGDIYDYEDIVLALSPKCEEDYNTVADYVHLKVHFQRPCSPVSILADGNKNQYGSGTTDGDQWVINKAPENEREQLFIKLVDYDPESLPLEDISLQYRRLGSNNWFDIETIEKEVLAAYYEQYIATYPNPTYPFVWDITDLDLVDGAYEVRTLSSCGVSGENYSNVLAGVIDRTSMQLFGAPEPADGILSLGDEISIMFNEAVDCAVFDVQDFSLINTADNSPVAHTVTCNDNQLIVVITELLSDLDGQMLQASLATGTLKDRSGNVLENPVTWEFKVHNSPVYWFPDSLTATVFRGQTITLNAPLYNTSVADRVFTLTDGGLSWIEPAQTSGMVPSSGRVISLTVDAQGLDVGTYQAEITAAIDGFKAEVLAVTVQVLPTPPGWEVDYSLYEDNLSVAANYNLDAQGISTDTLDMISVWVGNSIRGVANISKVSNNDYVAYLTVAGNTGDEGEALSFRVWDASTGTEYEGYAGQVYPYSKDEYYGTTASPVILTVDSDVDSARYVALHTGWNWISFNTEQSDMSVGSLLKSLDASEGDMIKTQNTSSIYSVQDGWESLDGLDELDTEQGYYLYVAQAGVLRLTGTDAVITSKALIPGWNLIGYQPQQAQSVDDALSNFSATNGDVIKSEYGFAEYSNDPSHTGWFGLDRMKPNKAYMIEVSAPKALQYSNGRSQEGENMAKYVGDWFVQPAAFEYNMTILGTLDFEGLNPDGMSIIAFVGEEPRGIGSWQYHEATDKYLVSLFVYANTDGEEVYFKLVDEASGDLYELANTEVFKTNNRLAGITNPYVFTTDLFSGSPMVRVVPNPFVDEAVISYIVPENELPVTIKVYDLGGMLVAELMEDELHQAGWHEQTLRSGQLLKAGMYVCKLQIGEEVISRKVIMQK